MWNLDFPLRETVKGNIEVEQVFCFENMEVSVISISAVLTECRGRFCNKINLWHSNGQARTTCGCDSMCDNKRSMVAPFLSLKLESAEGVEIYCTFSSQHFFDEFILTKMLERDMSMVEFQEDDIGDFIAEATTKVLEYGKKWKAIGWIKMGKSLMDSAEQPMNSYQGPKQTEFSEKKNYHLVRLEPMKPDQLDVAKLNSLKYKN